MQTAAPSLSNRRFPTLTHIWVAALFTVIIVRALAWPIPPNDFWWQAAYGRWIVEHGAIPRVDHFSFTQAGKPYFDQPWLAQLLLFVVYSAGGAALSLLLLTVSLLLTYWLILKVCTARTANLKLSAGLILLSLPVAMTNWSVRSQALAMPLFAATLAVLTHWRLGGSAAGEAEGSPRHCLWLLPILMLLWVNLHGSFVLGGVMIAVTFAVEGASRMVRGRRGMTAADVVEHSGPVPRFAPLVWWGALAALAILVNPRGMAIFQYVFGLVENPAIQTFVEEWMPPTIHTVVGKAFFGWALLVAALTVAARRWPDPVDGSLAGVFLLLALSAERHVIWFALASLPLIAGQAAGLSAFKARLPASAGRRGINLSLLALMAFAVGLVLPPIKTRLPVGPTMRPLLDPRTPVDAVRALRNDREAPDRLFHSEAVGSYLMWAAPERKVFVDVRVMLYPPAFLEDYRRISAGIGADSLLRIYGIEGLLLENERQAALLAWAEESGDWEIRHRDSAASYLVRRDALGPAVE